MKVVNYLYPDAVDSEQEPIFEVRARASDINGEVVFEGEINRDTDDTAGHMTPIPCPGRILRGNEVDHSMNPYTIILTAETIDGIITEERVVNMSETHKFRVIFSEGPCVVQAIADLVFPEDQELMGAFNCQEHFDDNGSTSELSFSYEGNSNVFVKIDETGIVSLSAAPNWSGSEHIDIIGANIASGASIRTVFKVTVTPVEDAPAAVITSPENGSKYASYDTVHFNCSDSSDGDGDIPGFYWYSNISGSLGSSAKFETTLDIGIHFIFLYVSDGSFNISTNVTITVENTPPSVFIDSPVNNSVFNTTTPVIFNGSRSSDAEDSNSVLNFTWRSDLDGVLGYASMINILLSEGRHNISLTVRDAYGSSASAGLVLVITEPVNNNTEPTKPENVNETNGAGDQNETEGGTGGTDPTEKWMSASHFIGVASICVVVIIGAAAVIYHVIRRKCRVEPREEKEEGPEEETEEEVLERSE